MYQVLQLSRSALSWRRTSSVWSAGRI